MANVLLRCAPPQLRVLRWLTDPGPGCRDEIRDVLLGEMFAEPKAVLVGLLSGLMMNITAVCIDRGREFILYMVLDVTIVVFRMAIVRRAYRAAARGRPAPTDLYLIVAILWCALQGAMAFSGLNSADRPLQILAAVSSVALFAPIAARNYAAPRYALLLICLVDLPLVAGAVLSGEPWLLLMPLQVPLFLFSCVKIVTRFQRLSFAALQAEYDSRHRARHDHLTGLLNRFGLSEALTDSHQAPAPPYVLFYLDLDGFKQVNDRFGHGAGDALLRQVAERLQANVRATDLVARLGGDEFVIVAAGLSARDAQRLSDSIIERISAPAYDIEGQSDIVVGVSIGFACAPQDGTALDVLHQCADAALYAAKRSGRGVSRRFAAHAMS